MTCLVFLKYPEEIRSKIYTTNAVESINAGLEYMKAKHSGYFASFDMLNVNLFIQYSNLHDNSIRRPDTRLGSVSYKLRQLNVMRFELGEEIRVVDLKLKGERC